MDFFSVLCLAIGGLLTGPVVLLYQVQLNTFLSQVEEHERYVIGRQSTAIGNEFDAIVSDLRFLSHQNELHMYLELGNAQTAQAIHEFWIQRNKTAAKKHLLEGIRK